MAQKVKLMVAAPEGSEGGNPIPTSTKQSVQQILLKAADPNYGGNKIPLPDYSNPSSRLKYAQSFLSKYGPLMQGRGNTPLKINEKPLYSDMTSKQLANKVGTTYGIDPALLYSSAMEEGMSALYPGERPIIGSNKDYPVDSIWSFGLDSFGGKYQDMANRGLLPKEFQNRFISDPNFGNRIYFKTPEDGLMATAAMWKDHYKDVDEYAKSNRIQLSPKARDFFSLVGFNGGEGTARQMISDYNKNGYLKNDAFLKNRPKSGAGIKPTSYAQVYDNVMRRIKMQEALKKEGLFDNSEERRAALAEMFTNPSKSKVLLRIGK